MNRRMLVLAALSMVVCASGAWALGKGGSMLAIEFTDGTADIADSYSPFRWYGYIKAYSVPEVGGQLQYWKMMSEDYAATIAVGGAISNETQRPGTGATPGAQDVTNKTNSFNVRVGGDRVVKVGDRALMYGGPGVEFWRGKAKYEYPDGTSFEGESTTRISVSARLGATMTLSEKMGLTAHVGHRFGYASAEGKGAKGAEGEVAVAKGAKATWWPSSFEGSMGLMWMFGGTN